MIALSLASASVRRTATTGLVQAYVGSARRSRPSASASTFWGADARRPARRRRTRTSSATPASSSSSLVMWGEKPAADAGARPYSGGGGDDDDSFFAAAAAPPSPRRGPVRVDDQGRRVRGDRGTASGGGGSGWDDFAPADGGDTPYAPYEYRRGRDDDDDGYGYDGRGRSERQRRGGGGGGGGNYRRRERDDSYDHRRGGGRGGGGGGSNDGPRPRRGGGPRNNKSRNEMGREIAERKVNMRALEKAGFDHLYGVAPVLNALKNRRRDFSVAEDDDDHDDEEVVGDRGVRRKPEARFTPYLFVQDNSGGGKRDDKARAAAEIVREAESVGVPVARTDKGSLNTLANNRPHQGFVLRCRALDFERLEQIPLPNNGDDSDSDDRAPPLWLVLDEVVDPQNLGALLRSARFLGGDDVGVLVCARNSAPLSPVASASSAGAMESVVVRSAANLPRTLRDAAADGWRVLGASVASPDGDVPTTDLGDLRTAGRGEPTLLVLGSEGRGLRPLVARACTELVRIPGRNDDADDVDSLNVSVTGGVLLWTLAKDIL